VDSAVQAVARLTLPHSSPALVLTAATTRTAEHTGRSLNNVVAVVANARSMISGYGQTTRTTVNYST